MQSAQISDGRLSLHLFGGAEFLGTLPPILQQLNFRPVLGDTTLPGASRPTRDVAIVDGGVIAAGDLWRRIPSFMPKIVVTPEASFAYRMLCAQAGVDAIVRQPVDPKELTEWLEHFCDQRADEPASILIVDDNELSARCYAELLRADGFLVEVATDPTSVFSILEQNSFDLILMDLQMPAVSGIDLAQMIRQSRLYLSVPIVFLSAERDAAMQMAARLSGGDEFISKQTDLRTLLTLVRLKVSRMRMLRPLIERDGLTGLLNHGRFKERVTQELERSRRTGSAISLAMVDIDHFKTVNDTWGHQVGDQVIRLLSRSLAGWLRRTDIVGRYGGEEFGVLLLDATASAAADVMEGFRAHVEAMRLDTGRDGHCAVTISVGIAGSAAWDSVHALVDSADAALYHAKNSGRNKVAFASPAGNGSGTVFRTFHCCPRGQASTEAAELGEAMRIRH
ncbi:GGDEF domain-containing protein [Prosthecodimorpha staleyi]|uniref:diguanylate cyclase n=1 Tax=Prosthecodimorpha staleyi TaxID=2840188 RepID=A0A947CZY5_9HYPH|nr:diguanylate cyclase [Prosthecodimorpha staleyi]MBT9288388.1 diguanylate cyclase [Prosthecodimorpha staleyi]